MNIKRIIFSGVITALVGAGICLVLAKIFRTPYTSSRYQNLDRTYATVGAIGGLLVGASQEALRQLKKQRDEEELRQK
ncbi:hypothetical protein [Fischerella sp. PCC 9605]|uniref:hypothetical protein n=1 Tax=Fischerella sp. PCC 9605 TaxID=1173024 RepID=UPI00047D3651|nr:hypothetical protein [Fischerella sp. PCC 9605]